MRIRVLTMEAKNDGLAIGEAVRAFFETLMTWQERAAQRRQLMTLDGRMLADVGLSQADAEAEFGKPFWRA